MVNTLKDMVEGIKSRTRATDIIIFKDGKYVAGTIPGNIDQNTFIPFVEQLVQTLGTDIKVDYQKSELYIAKAGETLLVVHSNRPETASEEIKTAASDLDKYLADIKNLKTEDAVKIKESLEGSLQSLHNNREMERIHYNNCNGLCTIWHNLLSEFYDKYAKGEDVDGSKKLYIEALQEFAEKVIFPVTEIREYNRFLNRHHGRSAVVTPETVTDALKQMHKTYAELKKLKDKAKNKDAEWLSDRVQANKNEVLRIVKSGAPFYLHGGHGNPLDQLRQIGEFTEDVSKTPDVPLEKFMVYAALTLAYMPAVKAYIASNKIEAE